MPTGSFLTLVVFVVLFGGQVGLAAPKLPNVVFIMADDQAQWARSGSGLHPNAVTPTMDRLANEGARFTNFFADTPTCSPARASIMTSRYGSELGITEWLKNGTKDPGHPDTRKGLDPYLPNIPLVLRAAGYSTALCGKWHLGENPAFHPYRLGFDYFAGFRSGGTSPVDPVLEVAEIDEPLTGLTCDIITDLALQRLLEHQEMTPDKPFFLALHFRAPHTKWLPVDEEDWEPFEAMKNKGLVRIPEPDYPGLDVARTERMTLEYLASVRTVDRNLSRLLMELRDLSIEDNTIVIYTSDHGYNMGHHGIWHKGNGISLVTPLPEGTVDVPAGRVPNLYDTSLKVPAIVRWPGKVEAGREITQTATHLDWLPTLVEITGIRMPIGSVMRGRSLVPLLEGKKQPRWKNDFFGQYSSEHDSRTAMRCYRTERFKLIRDFRNEGRDAFYDLAADPDEKNNLLGQLDELHVKILAELDEKLRDKMEEIRDPALDLLKSAPVR